MLKETDHEQPGFRLGPWNERRIRSRKRETTTWFCDVTCMRSKIMMPELLFPNADGREQGDQ